MLRGPDGQWSPAELGEAHAPLARALPLAEATGSAALEAEVYLTLILTLTLTRTLTLTPNANPER